MVAFCTVSIGRVGFYVFDPFRERQFLLDLAYSRTITPIAYVGGGSLTVVVMLPLFVAFVRACTRPEYRAGMPGFLRERHGERVVTQKSASSFASAVVVLGGVLYYSGYLWLRTHVPYIQHSLEETVETTERFTIQHHVQNKLCTGVIATNPAFASDHLCGVRLKGKWAPYYGKEIVLTGRRSPYGFFAERYTLPHVPQADG